MKNRTNSKSYRKWRIKVIRKQKRCISCYSIRNRTAHHVYDYSSYPKYRFRLWNGVCLCSVCHYLLHVELNNGYKNPTDFNLLIRLLNLVEIERDKFKLKRLRIITTGKVLRYAIKNKLINKEDRLKLK